MLVRSGGVMPRIGLMNRAISTISWPYSSYASASAADQRRRSRIVRPWSWTRPRESPPPAAGPPDRPTVVVDAPEVVATTGGGSLTLSERRERPVQREDVESVPRELKVADDLGPQERHDVREHGEPKAREDLLGHGGAAEHVSLLEHERPEPGLGEIGGADEAVVTTTDHDGVVGLGQGIGPPVTAIQTAYLRCDSIGPNLHGGGRHARLAGPDRREVGVPTWSRSRECRLKTAGRRPGRRGRPS